MKAGPHGPVSRFGNTAGNILQISLALPDPVPSAKSQLPQKGVDTRARDPQHGFQLVRSIPVGPGGMGLGIWLSARRSRGFWKH